MSIGIYLFILSFLLASQLVFSWIILASFCVLKSMFNKNYPKEGLIQEFTFFFPQHIKLSIE